MTDEHNFFALVITLDSSFHYSNWVNFLDLVKMGSILISLKHHGCIEKSCARHVRLLRSELVMIQTPSDMDHVLALTQGPMCHPVILSDQKHP